MLCVLCHVYSSRNCCRLGKQDIRTSEKSQPLPLMSIKGGGGALIKVS